MRMRDALLLCALGAAAFGIDGAYGEGPNLGKPIAPSDLAGWDIDVEPDGAGLPPGGGTSEQGAAIFADKCALCHGDGGKGGVFSAKGAPATTLPMVQMPNRDGFIPRFPERMPTK